MVSTQEYIYTMFAHRYLYKRVSGGTGYFTPRCLHTQVLLGYDAFRQRLETQWFRGFKPVWNQGSTQSHLQVYTQKCLGGDVSRQKYLFTEMISEEELLAAGVHRQVPLNIGMLFHTGVFFLNIPLLLHTSPLMERCFCPHTLALHSGARAFTQR